jgi:hypothetical protein
VTWARATWDFNERRDVVLLASSTCGGGTRDRGAACEVGYRVLKNVWLSGGLISGQHADEEFRRRFLLAWDIRARFKFDTTLLETMSSRGCGAHDIATNSPRR